jgi:hypothetical protein
LLHDYDRRLEWDTLLQAAADGRSKPASVQRAYAKASRLWVASRSTEYVSFHGQNWRCSDAESAAVFKTFAATIRRRTSRTVSAIDTITILRAVDG